MVLSVELRRKPDTIVSFFPYGDYLPFTDSGLFLCLSYACVDEAAFKGNLSEFWPAAFGERKWRSDFKCIFYRRNVVLLRASFCTLDLVFISFRIFWASRFGGKLWGL